MKVQPLQTCSIDVHAKVQIKTSLLPGGHADLVLDAEEAGCNVQLLLNRHLVPSLGLHCAVLQEHIMVLPLVWRLPHLHMAAMQPCETPSLTAGISAGIKYYHT